MKSLNEIKEQYSTKEICEILDNVICWRWDDRLGEKPEGFDKLPKYNIRLWDKLRKRHTKRQILEQIQWELESLVTCKEYYHYHHVECLGATEEEFEQWWRQNGKEIQSSLSSACFKKSDDGN